jgi:hypothetical protein
MDRDREPAYDPPSPRPHQKGFIDETRSARSPVHPCVRPSADVGGKPPNAIAPHRARPRDAALDSVQTPVQAEQQHLVELDHRNAQMSFSTTLPTRVRHGRGRTLGLVVAVAAVISVSVWTITAHDGDSARPPARTAASTRGPVLSSLSPRDRRYVAGIASLDPVSLRAAFGTARVSNTDAVLDKLAPRQRRYVRAISSMSYEQLAAAFGTARAIQTRAPHR